jgi:N-formylglutamate deformylase
MTPTAAFVPAGAPAIDPMPNDGVRIEPGLAHLVLDSPHSGTSYPHDFRHACDVWRLRQAEDTFVESLWGFAPTLGATLIHALFPRSYIDVNRALDDIDETMLDARWPGVKRAGPKVALGKGLVWRALDDGTPLYDRQLSVAEVQARIERCWMPYHGILARTIDGLSRHHRQLIHLNCHSMPSSAAAFSTEYPGVTHPDVVLGDRDGTTADPRLTRAIGRFFEARGYSVAINHPYKGVEIVRRYGNPQAGRHSIQVELNRRLYMDEQTLAPHAGYLPLRHTLRALTAALLVLDLRSGDMPEVLPAAEQEQALAA